MNIFIKYESKMHMIFRSSKDFESRLFITSIKKRETQLVSQKKYLNRSSRLAMSKKFYSAQWQFDKFTNKNLYYFFYTTT